MRNLSGAAIALAVVTAPVWAQSPGSTGAADAGDALEAVVVTARRVSENLMDVPVVATVLSAERIEKFALTDLTSIGNRIPQVKLFSNGFPAGGQMTIRGIGSSVSDPGQRQNVLVNLDGLVSSSGRLVYVGLFDVASVEVLEGPQALFFGKNSPAGVVSINTARPSASPETYLRARYEFEAEEKVLEGAVSGPLSETIRARFAFRADSMRGWVRNDAQSIANPFFVTNPALSPVLPGASSKYNGSEEFGGRLTIEYEPASDWLFTLKVLGDQLEDESGFATAELTRCPGAQPVSVGVADPFGNCSPDAVKSAGDLPLLEASSVPGYRDGKPYGELDTYLAMLTAEYSAGPYSFTSITGYSGYDQRDAGNGVYTVHPYGNVTFNEQHQDQWSEEIRVVTDHESPLNFAGGFYVERLEFSDVRDSLIAPLAPDPASGRYDTFDKRNVIDSRTYSAFVQAKWAIGPTLEVAGGARYTYEEAESSAVNRYIHPALRPRFLPVGLVLEDDTSSSNVSPEVTLTWHPSASAMFYGAYKTGFKPAGYASPSILSASTTMQTLTYKPFEAEGFEVGTKASFLNDSLRFTGTAYRYAYSDLPFSLFVASTFENQVGNSGGARSQGFTGSMDWRVTSGLTVTAAVGYADAYYTSFRGIIACYSGQTASQGCTAGKQDLTGQPLPRAPRWAASAGISYDVALFGNLRLGLSSELTYSDGYHTAETNNPLAYQDSYFLPDAVVRLYPDDERWDLSLIGRNLNDTHYIMAAGDNPNSPPGTITGAVARSRQVSLQAGFRF